MKTNSPIQTEARVMLLCGLLVAHPQQVLAQSTVPSGATSTTVTNAGNGVPVVNIAAPSASGLSHNAYTSYNVNTNGLILNNGDKSTSFRQSQLAGLVAANPNLAAGKQASVILNEVTGSTRSVLAGFTEVLGGTASVIVANPFGITCSGCGFINTDRVSLVTGTSSISGGVLTGFNVRGGDILITGAGVNASAQQILDLVSRKITIEGQVNANTLNMVAGTNNWNHATGATTAIASDGSAAPTWAIDSSLLGGMYAGRISLKSTEKGTGVRLLGNAAATADDFTITSAGKIEVHSQLSAVRDLALTSTAGLPAYTTTTDEDGYVWVSDIPASDTKDLIALTDASLTAGRDLTLTANQGGATLTGGSLVATRTLTYNLLSLLDWAGSAAGNADANKRYGATVAFNGASRATYPELSTDTSSPLYSDDYSNLFYYGSWTIDGVSYGAGTSFAMRTNSRAVLTVGASSAATLYSGGTMALSAGSMTLANAAVQSAGNMNLVGQSGLLDIGASSKIKSTAGNVTLTGATGGIANAGEISADTGNLTLSGSSVSSSGSLHASNLLKINNSGTVSIGGTALANEVSVTAAGDIGVDGDLEAAGNLTINAGGIMTVGSSGRVLAATSRSTGKGTITAATFKNSGVVHSYRNLELTGRVFNWFNGGISALGSITLTGTGATSSLYNGGSIYAATGLTANSFGSIDQFGTMESGGDITLSSRVFWNGSDTGLTGYTKASGNIDITVGYNDSLIKDFDNRGSSQLIASPTGTLAIKGFYRGNNAGTISGRTVTLTGARGATFANTGTIRATTLKATGFDLTNSTSLSPVSTTPPTVTSTTYPGLILSLPSNPNGRYVPSQNPNSSYLVESNPLYTNLDNFLGSDYLAEKYGLKSDVLLKRLGDAAYETYLVEQQLIAQIGAATLKGYTTEKILMQGLMDNAASQVKSLGLVYGKALTSEQQANLKQDVVWMVETTVNGQKVLAPVVYLASATRTQYATGSGVISADSINMKLTSLTNKDGGLITGKSIGITAQGDITNSGSTIKGEDISLKSTEGSVVNETTTKKNGYDTVVDKTGSIVASGSLSVDAAKDVVNKGATMSADGDVTLSAGRNVTFDTVETTASSSSNRTSKSLVNSTTWDDASFTVNQVKSQLSSGGNLTINAKKDITLAGTDASAKGNVALDADGNINILARENKEYSTAKKKTEGLFVAGGLWGSETITTDTEKTTSVGSTIKSGGNLSLSSGKTVTVQGSKVDAAKDIAIGADEVKVLAATDSTKVTTKKETTTFLSITGLGKVDASADAKAGASADAEASLQNVGTAKAGTSAKAAASTTDGSSSDSKAAASAGVTSKTGVSASAKADASADAAANVDVGGIDLVKQSWTTTTDTTTKAVGSSLGAGKNLTITARKTATLQGAKVDAKGDVSIAATDVKILAAEDTHTVTETSKEMKQGLYLSTDNAASSSASLKAEGSAGTGGVSGEAGASGSVSAQTSNSVDFLRIKTGNSETTDTTNVGSSLSSGGNLTIKSGNKLTVQGSDIQGGKDVVVEAKDMEFLAGKDSHTSTSTSSATGIGFYVDASVKAGAEAGANASAGAGASAGANAGANVSGEYGAGYQAKNTLTQSTESSTTAKVSSITSKSGSITRAATNSITDEGTAIDAAGDFSQTAKTWTSKAAADTSSSSTTTITNSAKLGVYSGASANAEASADAAAGLGATANAEADAKAKVVGGVQASYSGSLSKESESASNAVVSSIKSGGKIKSVTTDKTSLEGTQLTAGQGVELEAGSLNYAAAKNTTSKDTLTGSVDAAGKIGLGVSATTAVAVDLELSGTVKGKGTSEGSSTAVAGGITAGGPISIKTTGDTRLEGTTLASTGDTTVAAGGNLTLDAARDTTRKSETSMEVSGSFSTSAGKNALGVAAEASGSYSQSSSETSTAQVGSISSGGNVKLSAGKSATLEGTNIGADGDVAISGKEGVSMNAARNTTSEQSSGVNASLKVGADKEKEEGKTTRSGSIEGSLGANSSSSKTSDAVAGTVTAGRNLKISSDKDVTLEGTNLEAGNKAAIAAGGAVKFKAAESTSESSGFDLSLSGKAEGKTTTQDSGTPATGNSTGSDKSGSTPAGSSGSKSKNPGTGGTQGSDGSKKGDADQAKWQGNQASVLKELKAKQGGSATSDKKSGTGSSGTGGSTTAPGKTGTTGTTGSTGSTGSSTEKTNSASGSLTIEGGKTSTKTGGSIKAGAGGIDISAGGGNVDLEGTKVSTSGDANIAAKGDVKVTAAKNTESSYGVSVKGSGSKKTTTPDSTDKAGSTGSSSGSSSSGSSASGSSTDKSGSSSTTAKSGSKTTKGKSSTASSDKKGGTSGNQAGATGSVGINAGSAVTGSAAAEISTGGKLNITSGGKTALTDTKVDAKGGEKIQAVGGSDRKAP